MCESISVIYHSGGLTGSWIGIPYHTCLSPATATRHFLTWCATFRGIKEFKYVALHCLNLQTGL